MTAEFILHLDTSALVAAANQAREAIERLQEVLGQGMPIEIPLLAAPAESARLFEDARAEANARIFEAICGTAEPTEWASKSYRPKPPPNGVRVVHGEARLRGFDHISGTRWRPVSNEPTRVRTCSGRRR